MLIEPDDDVYRVNAVWLGPPKATLPWHARYVAWGVGLFVFFFVVSVQRMVGIGFGFFATAWALVVTVALTKALTKLINFERPLGAVVALFVAEARTPRERTTRTGGAFRTSRVVQVRRERPRPDQKRRSWRFWESWSFRRVTAGSGSDSECVRCVSATAERAVFCQWHGWRGGAVL